MKLDEKDIDPILKKHAEAFGLEIEDLTTEKIIQRHQQMEEARKYLNLFHYDYRRNLRDIDGKRSFSSIDYDENMFNRRCQILGLDPATVTCEVLSAQYKGLIDAINYFIYYAVKRDVPRHYKTLGIPVGANQAMVNKTYRRLMVQIHPDRQQPAAAVQTDSTPPPMTAEEAAAAKSALDEYFQHPEVNPDVVAAEERQEAARVEKRQKWADERKRAHEFYNGYCRHPFVLKSHAEYRQDLLSQQKALEDFHEHVLSEHILKRKLSPEEEKGSDAHKEELKKKLSPLAVHLTPDFSFCSTVPQPSSAPRVFLLPSPILGLIALYNAVRRGRLDLKRLYVGKGGDSIYDPKTRHEFVFEEYLIGLPNKKDEINYLYKAKKHIPEDVEFFSPWFLIPEVFGEDYGLQMADRVEALDFDYALALHRYENNLPSHKLVTIEKNERKRGVNARGENAVFEIYLKIYSERATGSYIQQNTDLKKQRNLYGRIEWAIVKELVKRHQRTIAAISYQAPEQLVSLTDGHWVFNPRTVDALIAHIFYIDCFFTEGNEQDITKIYLNQLNIAVLQPIYGQIERLKGDRAGNLSPEDVAGLIALWEDLLKLIEQKIQEILMPYFMTLEGRSVAQDTQDILSVDREEALEKSARLRAKAQVFRPELDEALLKKLHEAMIPLLQQQLDETTDENNKPFFFRLKDNFCRALTVHCRSLVEAEYEEAKRVLKAQIDAMALAQKGSFSQLVSEKANHAFQEMLILEREEKQKGTLCYSIFTERMNELTTAIKSENPLQAGIKLRQHADSLSGAPSPGWRALGAILMGLGALLAIAGALMTFVSAVPTFGVGVFASAGMTCGGVALFGVGTGLFYHHRREGLSKAVDAVGEQLKSVEPASIPSRPKQG